MAQLPTRTSVMECCFSKAPEELDGLSGLQEACRSGLSSTFKPINLCMEPSGLHAYIDRRQAVPSTAAASLNKPPARKRPPPWHISGIRYTPAIYGTRLLATSHMAMLAHAQYTLRIQGFSGLYLLRYCAFAAHVTVGPLSLPAKRIGPPQRTGTHRAGHAAQEAPVSSAGRAVP